MQFDEEARGFSFQNEGPLDMRMDQTATLTARDVINDLPEADLQAIFRDFGEEPFWKRSAKAVVEARRTKPFETTRDLAVLLENTLPRKKIHAATRIFQALRIYVNKELESIEGSLKKAIEHLAPGGRVGVLSFHSLEDRIVKNVFREASAPLRNLQGRKIDVSAIRNLTKQPLVPSFRESKVNRRARSAKLRFAERVL